MRIGNMVDIEKEIIKSFINGSEEAFNKLVNKYQQKIYWHARRMLGNHIDADEVTQEVLIVMYKKLHTFKFDSSLYTWLFSITSRRSLNFIKKRNIRKIFSLDSADTTQWKSEDDIVNDLENKEKLNKLEKVLQSLPSKQREVFILRNFEQLSYQEISEITGKSVGGLKANYFHALKKIMELTNED